MQSAVRYHYMKYAIQLHFLPVSALDRLEGRNLESYNYFPCHASFMFYSHLTKVSVKLINFRVLRVFYFININFISLLCHNECHYAKSKTTGL
jgi:hypothetical protein